MRAAAARERPYLVERRHRRVAGERREHRAVRPAEPDRLFGDSPLSRP